MISLKLKEGVELPTYESALASGADVKVHSILKVFKGDIEKTGEELEKIQKNFEERGWIKLRGHERILFGTGIYVADMPQNLEIQVRSRSGIALKRGLFVANSPGTIDADYRGEIGIIVYNSTPYLNKVSKGERIAQIVTAEANRCKFAKSYEIIETERGGSGFGSSGTL